MKKKYTFITIQLFLFLLYSCEYETEELAFKSISEHGKEDKITININNLYDGDTVYIYKETLFDYQREINDHKVTNFQVYLDNKELPKTQFMYNSVSISPETYDNSIHTLKFNIELQAKSGSLADKLGLETIKKECIIYAKYVKSTNKLNIFNELTSDKHLKFVWNQPNIERVKVAKYEIKISKSQWDNDSDTKVIKNPLDTFIIDNDYIFGYRNIEIKTYFEDNKLDPWTDYYSINDGMFDGKPIIVKEIDSNHIKVTWTKNKYKCSYAFWDDVEDTNVEQYPTHPLILDYETTSIIIPNNIFPNTISGRIKPIPVSATSESYNLNIPGFELTTPFLGDDFYPYNFKCNVNKKKIYGIIGYKIIMLDSIDQHRNPIIYQQPENRYTDNIISCSNKTGKISYMGSIELNKNVYVADENLKLISSFVTPIQSHFFDSGANNIFAITDNDEIIISDLTYSRKLMVFNLVGEIVAETVIPFTPLNTSVIASTDGKYICAYTNLGITIYKLENSKLSLITIKDISGIETCEFDVLNSQSLIIQKSTYFYKYDIIKNTSSSITEGIYLSSDPFNGNILYYDKLYSENQLVNVADNKLEKILYKQRVKNNFRTTIIDNVLIGVGNYKVANFYKRLNKTY